MKKLGIVGGMGPYATALFYKKLTQLTKAESDSEHIECIIYSVPQIPDRSAFITGKSSNSPLEKLISVCRTLEKQIDVIALPCMTSHHFFDEISNAVSVPVLDMHSICAKHAKTSALGIMATEGTIASGRLMNILRENKIEPILPTRQNDVTRLIYDDVKAGKGLSKELFNSVVKDLADKGAQKVLLACTELQVYTDIPETVCPYDIPLLDAAELLARSSIHAVGGKVNDEYSAD